jgi:uncharacterized CHY-type Zn-finger protein
MTGYAFMYSDCFTCHGMFGYHPHKVPSIRDANNVRQPVCGGCIHRANVERVKRGLEPLAILPGAYEPCPEEEL